MSTELVIFRSINHAEVSAAKMTVIEELIADVLHVSRVLSQFYLLSRPSLQTTWTPLRILVLRTFKGLNYHFSCHFLRSDCNIFINFQ